MLIYVDFHRTFGTQYFAGLSVGLPALSQGGNMSFTFISVYLNQASKVLLLNKLARPSKMINTFQMNNSRLYTVVIEIKPLALQLTIQTNLIDLSPLLRLEPVC